MQLQKRAAFGETFVKGAFASVGEKVKGKRVMDYSIDFLHKSIFLEILVTDRRRLTQTMLFFLHRSNTFYS